MPIQVNFLQDGVGVEFVYSGAVTGKDFLEANAKIYNQETLSRLKYKIIDRSACTDYRITSDDIRVIALQEFELSKMNRNILILFVSKNDLQYGMSRMWQAYADVTGFQSEIVKDRKSADEYIASKMENQPWVMNSTGMETPGGRDEHPR